MVSGHLRRRYPAGRTRLARMICHRGCSSHDPSLSCFFTAICAETNEGWRIELAHGDGKIL